MPDAATLGPWIALAVSLSTVLFSLLSARHKIRELLQRDQELRLKTDAAYIDSLRERINDLEEEATRAQEKLQRLTATITEQDREIAKLWRMIIRGEARDPGRPGAEPHT